VPLIFSYYLSLLAHKKTDVVVYDTDVLTWAADRALDGGFEPKEVQDFYAQVVLPRVGSVLVVSVDTPIETAVERWRLRDDQELSEREVNEWVAERVEWKKARTQVVEALAALPGVEVLRIDGTNDQIENARIIIEKVKV
jgi:thymidylate kinase